MLTGHAGVGSLHMPTNGELHMLMHLNFCGQALAVERDQDSAYTMLYAETVAPCQCLFEQGAVGTVQLLKAGDGPGEAGPLLQGRSHGCSCSLPQGSHDLGHGARSVTSSSWTGLLSHRVQPQHGAMRCKESP